MITLKQLRCFVTVVKTGGFLQASIQLNLTQPTVTKSISNLEEYLGVALFDKPLTHRKKRLVNLTEIGEHLYIQAVDILQKADKGNWSVFSSRIRFTKPTLNKLLSDGW